MKQHPLLCTVRLHTGPNTQFGGFHWGFFKVCMQYLPQACKFVTVLHCQGQQNERHHLSAGAHRYNP